MISVPFSSRIVGWRVFVGKGVGVAVGSGGGVALMQPERATRQIERRTRNEADLMRKE